jgi:long-chain fatty acid transport protein
MQHGEGRNLFSIKVEKRMRSGTVILLGILIVSISAIPAAGGGLGIPGVGAKAEAMGGTYRGIANDWSAAYYNPAALYYMTENQLTFNEVFTHYRFQYEPDVKYGDRTVGFYRGNIYNRYEILTNPTAGGFFRLPIRGQQYTFGLAVFQPFDKNVSWRVFQPLNNTQTLPDRQLQHNFDAVAFNVTAAYELQEDKLTAGISTGVLRADLIYAGIFLRPNPADPNAPYYNDIASRPNDLITEWQHSDGNGYGFNLRAGVLYKASPRLTVGVSGAIPTTITVDGTSELAYYLPDIQAYHSRSDVRSQIDSVNYILSSGALYSARADFTTKVKLPGQVGAGAAYQVNDRLLVAGDLEYTMWSYFKGYKFDYTFDDPDITRNDDLNVWMRESMAVPVDWHGTLRGAVGAEYAYSDMLRLRGGYAADQTPVEEGSLQPAFFDSGLKHIFSLGLGFVFENVVVDLATQYTYYPESREGGNVYLTSDGVEDRVADNLAGTFKGSAFESILQFTVRF